VWSSSSCASHFFDSLRSQFWRIRCSLTHCGQLLYLKRFIHMGFDFQETERELLHAAFSGLAGMLTLVGKHDVVRVALAHNALRTVLLKLSCSW
jgi:hypothetical protein